LVALIVVDLVVVVVDLATLSRFRFILGLFWYAETRSAFAPFSTGRGSPNVLVCATESSYLGSSVVTAEALEDKMDAERKTVEKADVTHFQSSCFGRDTPSSSSLLELACNELEQVGEQFWLRGRKVVGGTKAE